MIEDCGMDLTLNNTLSADIETRISSALSLFKLSNVEKALSDLLDNFSNDSPINYVGELNKNDVML